MNKYYLECPYVISHLPEHQKIKKEVLQKIDFSEYDSPKDSESEVDITKTDWHISQNFDRDWLKPLINPMIENLKKMYESIGFNTFKINEIWFQQYMKNSVHGWHSHSSNFTNVYYLELPDDAPKTKILNPFDRKTIIELDVKEGDMVFFPSFVLHKAPENKSNLRKTIVSYNIDVMYSQENYGKGIYE